VDREVALVKVLSQGEARLEAMRLAEIFRARVVDSTLQSMIFEVSGRTEKVQAFIDLMTPLGCIEIVRTGCVAMARGEHPF
jgi:acetolactate synthase-1/3 small subunit